MEGAEMFNLLESNQPQIVENIKKKFHELINSCNPNETWLVNGLFDYAMQTGSIRTVEILIGIREPHDIHLFNKFSESLRGYNKLQGLTLLGHVVRRQPTWMFKITRHSLFRELLKLLKTETEIIPLMSALLVINILLPMVAGLMEHYLQELFSVFSHLAKWDTMNPQKLPECHLFHLQMGLYALFLRLYGMYPCNFLSYLRTEYSQSNKILIFNHTIRPMLDTVKVHPLLVTASKDIEVSPARWRKMETHDVIAECAKLAINNGDLEKRVDEGSSRVSLDFSHTLAETRYLCRSASGGDNKEVWSPTAYIGINSPTQPQAPESAPTSIPHTPIAQTHIASTAFPLQEGASPPEAAVEATPETTPVKDPRSIVRHPPNSCIPRTLNAMNSPNHSQPSSPMRKEASPFRFPNNSESSAFQSLAQDRRDSLITQKVQRLVTDRVQTSTESTDNKVAKSRGLMQPTSPLRVINTPTYGTESPAELLTDQEDREVEITMTSESNSIVWNPRQCDSVVQDITSNDHDDLEECQQESCTAGGICMPNSNSMWDFTRKVNSRLRFYSQCHADPPYPGVSTGSSPSDVYSIPINVKVRRANSCPEMKKSCSSSERHPVEKVDEEPSPVNGVATDFSANSSNGKESASTGTQTDNPLPYEHLFLSVFPTVDHTNHFASEETSANNTNNSSPQPQRTLSEIQMEAYMNLSIKIFDGRKSRPPGEEMDLKTAKDLLQLMQIQIQFEKHRRELHAERNRRLMGKCRKVRSQEELTAALKDQVSLLQTDNELLHNNLHKRAEEARVHIQQLQDMLNSYQNQHCSLQIDYTKEKNLRESVEEMLKQEREKTAIVTKELNETKAALFNVTNELHHVSNVANEGQSLRESVLRLQKELVAGAEVQERYRQRVNNLLRLLQDTAEVAIINESYSKQINALKQESQNQNESLVASKLRENELDTISIKQDATTTESTRLLQEAKNEFHEQLKAVEIKYNSLKTVNSQLEGELLELQHQLRALQAQSTVEGVAHSPRSVPLSQRKHFQSLQGHIDIDAPHPSDFHTEFKG